MRWEQTTEPSGYPVRLDEAKEHLKVTYSDEDFLIQSFIGAATEHAESVTRRALMPRTFAAYFDQFPNSQCVELPRPRLQSISSVSYYDEGNSQQVLSSSKYYVDTVAEPGRICLASGEVWPGTYERPNAVTISFTAGYVAIGDVPRGIHTAILLMVAHWFENREAVVIGPTGLRIHEVPQSAGFLLDQYRVMGFF